MASVTRKDAKSPPALAFLTVVEDPADGLFGGYLTLNLSGRPLEFHCTAPIKANRAQEILYGPTLEPYLYGEQIGQTLIEKATVAPLAIFTDRSAAMAVRRLADVPVALVLPNDAADQRASSPEQQWRIDSAHPRGEALSHFALGANRLAVSERSMDDRRTIEQCLAEVADGFDLAEPFTRIVAAIEEARAGHVQ